MPGAQAEQPRAAEEFEQQAPPRQEEEAQEELEEQGEPGEEMEVLDELVVHVESAAAPEYRVAVLAGQVCGADEPIGQ